MSLTQPRPLTRTFGVPPAQRQDLGLVALGLVAAGPVLIVLGVIADVALGYLYPLTFLLAAVVAVPLTFGGLLLGLVAVVVHRGRWKGVAAMVASVPAAALAFPLAHGFLLGLTSMLEAQASALP